MYQTILFDLDGTLTDSSLGITNAAAYALEKMGISVSDRKELLSFIGPPLIESFQTFYHFSPEKSLEAVVYYREYYTEKGLFENTVYPHVPKLLENIHSQGKQLILATSKPEVFAKKILKHFGLDRYFTIIAGASLDSSRIKKADVIAYALAQLPLVRHQTCIIVGDREHDIIGAQENDIASMGILYGFGNREELEQAGATYISDDINQTLEILL